MQFKNSVKKLSNQTKRVSYSSGTSWSKGKPVTDPGLILGGGAPLRNGITDCWPDETTFFFSCWIPVALESRRWSQRGCASPAPSPRSAPASSVVCWGNNFNRHPIALSTLWTTGPWSHAFTLLIQIQYRDVFCNKMCTLPAFSKPWTRLQSRIQKVNMRS